MGISLPLSLKSLATRPRMRHADGSFRLATLACKIAKRSALLLLFGLVTSNGANLYLDRLRLMGVLQRFALTYAATALVELAYFKANGYAYSELTPLDASWSTR